MKRSHLLATGLALTSMCFAVGPTGASADAAPTCQGRAATIVGSPGAAVLGTPGPDVIVAIDAPLIEASAGDDLVCATGGRAQSTIRLGAGADTLEARGTTAFRVDAGDADDVALGQSPSTDVITTDAGSDQVTVGATGQPDTDQVSLGGALDVLTIDGIPMGQYDGGPVEGDTGSWMILRDLDHHAWSIDTDPTAGFVQADILPAARLTGFSLMDLNGLAWSTLDFHGSALGDSLLAAGPNSGTGPVHVKMGSGYDRVQVLAAVTGSISLGSDSRNDLLVRGAPTSHPSTSMQLRLGSGWTTGARSAPTRLQGRLGEVNVRDVASVDVTGSARPDLVRVAACRADVNGLAGSDDLTLHVTRGCARLGPFRADGGAGNDTLVGTPHHDVLIGGPGRDLACGDGGHDVIRAEQRC